MYIKDGKRFNINAPHIINGVQYPAGSLRDPNKMVQLGISEIADPERKDEQFFYVTEQDDAPYVVNTPKPLDQVKDAIWEKIKAHRDGLSESGGYKVVVADVDKWFHSDTKSKTQQIALVMMGANIAAGLQWKTMDGTFVEMTQTLAGQVFQAAAVQDSTIFAVAEQHRAAVNALADVDAIAAYDWSTDWPEVYVAAEAAV